MTGEEGSTRRTLLARGLAAGGAAGAALAIGGAGAGSAGAAAAVGSVADARLLGSLAAVEQVCAKAYRILSRGDLLAGADAAYARACASAARADLAAVGGHRHPAAPAVATPSLPPAATLAKARTSDQALAYAVRLESGAIAAYHDAFAKLQDPSRLRTLAETVADHGLRLASWRVAAGVNPLPQALEIGAKS